MSTASLRDEVTDLLQRLIRVDTTNPPGNETAAAELLRDYLEANGVACELIARVPERAVSITRRGRPVLAVMPWEFYESIVETLEILSDPEMASALRESVEDIKRGRMVSHVEAKKRLGL